MNQLKIVPLLIMFTILFINSQLFAQSDRDENSLSNEYYDLTPGMERHFGLCGSGFAFNQLCIPEYFSSAVEKVVGSVEIGEHTYAIVTWKESVTMTDKGTKLSPIDTLFFRMEGSTLLEYSEDGDKAIFDYGFSAGDSIYSRISRFMNKDEILEVLDQNLVEQRGIASTVLLDTLLTFGNGVDRNVLWADDTLAVVNRTTGETTILPALDNPDFQIGNYPPGIPVPAQYDINKPFYYLSKIGIMFSPINHRRMSMCGFVEEDGSQSGCDVSRWMVFSGDHFTDIPTGFILQQNYPNPFNPATQIRFYVPAHSRVQLGVYTILGQELATLVNETMSPGWHDVTFDAAGLSSGTLIYRLQSGDHIETKQMMLVR